MPSRVLLVRLRPGQITSFDEPFITAELLKCGISFIARSVSSAMIVPSASASTTFHACAAKLGSKGERGV